MRCSGQLSELRVVSHRRKRRVARDGQGNGEVILDLVCLLQAEAGAAGGVAGAVAVGPGTAPL